MNIFVQGILSVGEQCQVVKDAPNLCSKWFSVIIFSLILYLKILPHRLDKGFVIGGFFLMGSYDC